jgi:hypothetical protein
MFEGYPEGYHGFHNFRGTRHLWQTVTVRVVVSGGFRSHTQTGVKRLHRNGLRHLS